MTNKRLPERHSSVKICDGGRRANCRRKLIPGDSLDVTFRPPVNNDHDLHQVPRKPLILVLGQDKNICPVISGFPEAVLDGFEKLLDDGSVCLLGDHLDGDPLGDAGLVRAVLARVM